MSEIKVSVRHLDPGTKPSLLFGPSYYTTGCGPVPYERSAHWLNFFSGIADEIVRSLRPKRVFDAGCAWGFLVEGLWTKGVEAHGVDISEYAIGKVRPDLAGYCKVASLTEPIQGGPYDLVTCIEVLEHMPAPEARVAIENLTRASDTILFSSTPDDFEEPTHFNVRPPLYWLKLFAERNFYPDLGFNASFVAPHAMLLRRGNRESVPEGAVNLFCEVLGLRADRVHFLTRHGRIEELERENANLRQRVDRAEEIVAVNREKLDEISAELLLQRDKAGAAASEAATHREKALELRGQLDRIAAETEALREQNQELSERLGKIAGTLAETRAHEARLTADLGASDAARRVAEQSVTDLRREASDFRSRLEDSEALMDEWMARASELSSCLNALVEEREALRDHVDAISASPGWRVVERYRAWLQSHKWRNGWVDTLWEPGMQWVLRRMQLGGGPLPRRVSPAPAPLTEVAVRPAHVPLPSTRNPEPQTASPERAQPVNGRANDYDAWIFDNEPGGAHLDIQRSMSACFSYRPKITVLVPVYKVPFAVLREMVESVAGQTYDNWELSIAMANPEDTESLTYLQNIARRDSRVRVWKLDINEGISGNSNRALEQASGEFVALLDHDDRLTPSALFEVVQLLNQDRAANFIYSDKDQIDAGGKQRLQPLFKPQWSPDLMLNANYLTHLCVMRTEHVRAVGGWRRETDGAQDWDIFLRVIRKFGGVRHIPKVLYHWRQLPTSVASGGLDAKPYAAAGQIRTVRDHLRELTSRTFEIGHELGNLRIEWTVPAGETVSVIFLTAGGEQAALDRASEIATQTDHPSFEFLVPVSSGTGDGPVRAVRVAEGSDLRRKIEAAAKAATGTVLVFLDEAARPTDPKWLREITGPLQVPGVGLTGGRMNDSRTGAIRHCGIVFTPDGRYEYIYAGYPDHVCEQFGGAGWYRNWSAVSGACFAIRADVWAQSGAADDPLLYPRLDIDLCLKLRIRSDLRIFYNPYARFLQDRDSMIESLAWGSPGTGVEYLRVCFSDGDPYFNPNLDCRGGKVIYKLPERNGRAPAGNDYSAESQVLVQIFDCAPSQIERSRRASSKAGNGRLDSITWLLPDFGNPFYGGIHTILRFADAFRRRHGVESSFCVLARAVEAKTVRQIAAAFPELAAQSKVFVVDDPAKVRQLPRTDAAVCSLWTTAFAALEFDNAKRKFYFIQDDEALFYPAGSTSALVEASYGFGFHGICNTPSLLNQYKARGGDGEYFAPCIDPSVFHDRVRKPSGDGPPYTLFCYGRPTHPRNCFELLGASLRMLKKRFGKDLTIITAGADWDLKAYGLDGVVQHLGLLNYQATGALYRTCDAGLVMMMTRHPSYLPLELMACGSLVITNQNPDTAWLLRDGENCLLGAPTPTSLADRVEEGLRNSVLRRRIVANARAMVQQSYQDWEVATGKIHRYMKSQC